MCICTRLDTILLDVRKYCFLYSFSTVTNVCLYAGIYWELLAWEANATNLPFHGGKILLWAKEHVPRHLIYCLSERLVFLKDMI